MMKTPRSWRSIHLYCHQNAAQDDLLLEIAHTLAEGDATWFFIRYWLGGPHLRIRVDDIDGVQIARVRELGERFFAHHRVGNLDPDTYHAMIPSELREGNVDDEALPWYQSGTLRDEAYLPETERYGGPEALPSAENTFVESSALCVKVVHATRSPASRLVAAAYIMRAFAARTGLEGKLAPYGRFWLGSRASHVPETTLHTIVQSSHRAVFPRVLEQHIDRLAAAFAELPTDIAEDRRALIAASQVHMTNNRLGVPTEWEGLIGQHLWGAQS